MTATLSALGGVVKRREDPALIHGRARYVDDIKLANMAHAAFVRSPYPHARVTDIDASEALAMEGVFAVYTADDVRHLGLLLAQITVVNRPLLVDVAKHAGDAVAMVVAADRYVAQDAADAIHVEYDVLPSVTNMVKAATNEILVHDGMESNVILSWEGGPFGDEEGIAATRKTIAEARKRDDTVTVSIEMRNQRLLPTAIEPRCVLADWNGGYSRFDLYSSTQIPHALAGAVAKTFGLPYNSVRCLAQEVGGGFGAKLNVYSDEMLVCFASQKLHRPVKWTETRREAANSTIQGRGWVATASMTGTRDGELLGYELTGVCDMGAYTQNFTAAIPFLGVFVGSGQYKMPTYIKLDCVVTHTMTTDAYRGAGRPEAIYYLERILDAFAREIDMDPADVRRKNFIPNDAFPSAISPIGFAMDTGDYATNLDALLAKADYEGLKAERDAARAEGRLVGIGLSSYVEVCGFGPSGLVDLGFSWSEYGLPSAFNGNGVVRVHPDGTVTCVIGTGPSGQGHQTTWAQIISHHLAVPIENVRVIHGDTHESPVGIGSFGSRSAAVDGSATWMAADRVRDKAAKLAAHLLEAAPEDIRFADNEAHVAGSPYHKVSWSDIATLAYQPHRLPEGMEGGLEAAVVFSPANATWPFGTHLALVEIDPDTGNTQLLRYIAMDDCGEVINPMIVDGQIHGGIAQGVGQAMFEEAIYDEDGNLLSASLMDYLLPTAADLPSFELDRTVTPTDVNPMGVKGVGEAGTIGSAQPIVNAVVDALSPFGVKHIDMPVRPKRVWEAIQAAKGA
ncbi:MAG: molybdopterin-dependent oxidoreductase [Acidimicrobiia bacterium]|nr:molybdopterin-dependent oxidoreductase [Acidimicrobiia bacterium]